MDMDPMAVCRAWCRCERAQRRVASGGCRLACAARASADVVARSGLTLECACGIAPIDSFASLNDDGNAIGQEEQGELDERDYANMVDLIEASRTLDELKVNYRKAQDAAESAKDHSAAKTFAEIKNKMYRKLAKA